MIEQTHSHKHDALRSMTEAEFKGIVCRLAVENGWMVKETEQGSQNRPRRPARRTTNNGYPDLTLARDGEILFLELKDEDGTQSIMQMAWSDAIRGLYHVLRPRDLPRGRVEELLR